MYKNQKLNTFKTMTVGIFVYLLALGQLQRISLLGVSLYLHDLFIFVWVLCSFFYLGFIDTTAGKKALVTIKKRVSSIPLSIKTFCVFAISWILLGWLYQASLGNLDYWPLLYSLRIVLYGAGIVLIFLIPVTKDKKNGFLSPAIISNYFILILSWGWLQLLFIPDTRWLSILGWDDHLGRMIGTQFDPNFFGLLLLFGWWWGIHQINMTKNSKDSVVKFGLTVLFLCTSIAALTVTWSRSTYVAFIGLALFFLMTKLLQVITEKSKLFASEFIHKFMLVVLSLLLFFVSLITIPKPVGEGGNITRTSTISSRIQNSQSSLYTTNTVEKILGQGLFVVERPLQNDRFTRENHAKLPTSFPIFLLKGLGIGGILFLILVVFEVGRKTLKNGTLSSHLLQKFQITIGALVATLLHSLANLSLIQPFILLTLLLMFAWEITQARLTNLKGISTEINSDQ